MASPKRNFFSIDGKLISVGMPKYPRNNMEEGNGVYFDAPNRLVLYFAELKSCIREKVFENRNEAAVEWWWGKDVITEGDDWGYWTHVVTYKFTNLKFKSYLQDSTNLVKADYFFDSVLEVRGTEHVILPVPHVPDFTRYPRPVLTGEAILGRRQQARGDTTAVTAQD